jgi:hypothetical protein
MSDLSFTPTFHHDLWIDNVSRVRAAGADGFNGRFQAIEADLARVSTVVAAISTELDQVASGPPPGTPLRPPLDVVSQAAEGFGPWIYDASGAIRPAVGGSSPFASGSMDLSLPDHITLTSMRLRGTFQAAGASMTVSIQGISLSGNIDLPANQLAQIHLDGTGIGNPFDLTVQIDGGFGAVDNDQFRYALKFDASYTGNAVPFPDTSSVDSVEFAYTAA